MSYPNSLRVRELWLKMKAYINNRIETLEQGVTMKLLWENPNPTSSFAAQTVELDLSEYDKVLVIFKSYNTQEQYISVICKKDINTRCSYLWDASYIYLRNITPKSSGVTFGDCYYGKLLQSMATQNTGLIPIEIYGIKGVQ